MQIINDLRATRELSADGAEREKDSGRVWCYELMPGRFFLPQLNDGKSAKPAADGKDFGLATGGSLLRSRAFSVW